MIGSPSAGRRDEVAGGLSAGMRADRVESAKGSAMQIHDIHIPEQEIEAFCERHGVARLSLFGSVLRDDFTPESDVDVLVEFFPGRTPGMFGFGQMIIELREIIGRDVDLRTPNDLSRYFREEVLRSARLLHAA